MDQTGNRKPEQNRKNDDGRRPLPNKISVYNEFILWSAMPPMEQRRLGLETQEAFCEYYNINPGTPSDWKKRNDFHPRRMAILRMWAGDKTPAVVQGIYMSAIKGNSDSQRIWLQYFEGWTEKIAVEHTKKVEFGPGDIRFIIERLPEELRAQHYANLRKLLDDAVNARASGAIEDAVWTDRPPLPIQYSADQDASDLPDQATSKISKSYPHSLRANMVGSISAHHHQSPTWRGQE